MELTACIQTYNRRELLVKCIETAGRFCNRIIVVDGAFANYPHKNPSSTDGTIELVQQMGAELIITNEAYKSEAAKRNAYLDLLHDNEWFIYLDDDEQLLSLDEGIEKDMAHMRLLIGKDSRIAVRLIKYKLGLRYVTHFIASYRGQAFDLSFNQPKGVKNFGEIRTTPTEHTPEYNTWKQHQLGVEAKEQANLIRAAKLLTYKYY